MLSAAEIAATVGTIVAAQQRDGAIPWWPDGPIDPWNLVEAAMGLDTAGAHHEAESAYRWLADRQNDDGSFCAEYHGDTVTDAESDTNFTAYVAVGIRHHALCTGDRGFTATMWPMVRRAIEFALTRQEPDGQCRWRSDGRTALLAGCASIHLSLRAAGQLAADIGAPRPDWTSARGRLRDAIRTRPDLFEPKPHAMDWYYPVLTGIAAGEHLNERWQQFVVRGLGVRCVADEPWVTGAETAELALTLACLGRRTDAVALFDCLDRLRDQDGRYWTGYQYANRVLWPDERTTWTAGAVLLAAAALTGHLPTLDVFGSAAKV
ncbi:MAG TPA: prenyltransferase [Pseudonocardiaceae bacterium]|nr:prenyltransferase [Pseudonocardiaceae bacterium]